MRDQNSPAVMLDRAEYTHPSPRLPHWRHVRRGSVRDRDDPVAMLDGAETTHCDVGLGLPGWHRA